MVKRKFGAAYKRKYFFFATPDIAGFQDFKSSESKILLKKFDKIAFYPIFALPLKKGRMNW